MKLIEALQEKELKMPKYLINRGESKSFGVWLNPSKSDISKAIKESDAQTQAARFIADPDDFKVYVFSADILHEAVRNDLKLKASMLMYGLISKEGNKYKGMYGDIFNFSKEKPTYEKILKENWQWLEKYFDTEPIFRTLMMRYKNETK